MQPIPPREPAELQPKKRLGSQEAAWQLSARAGRPSLGSPPLPQGPMLLSWPSGVPLVLDSHQPWAFGGFNPCVFGGVSPFSLIFKAFTTSSPLSMSITPPVANPDALASTAAARARTLGQTPPALCSRSSTMPPSGGLRQCPGALLRPCPLPTVAQLKTNDTHNTQSGRDGPHRSPVGT